MKKILLIPVLMLCLNSVSGQISLKSDSIVISNFNQSQEKFVPIKQVSESLVLEIDKDLLTLRVYGQGHEHAVIEKAYVIDLLEVDSDFSKWIFQGEDRNCVSFTITLDTDLKSIDLITFGKEPAGNKPLTMIHYHVTDFKIDKEAISQHIREKADNKL
jgi:hypothetical protein